MECSLINISISVKSQNSGMKVFLQTLRALANSQPADQATYREVLEKARADSRFCLLTEHLVVEGHVPQGGPLIYVMSDPRSSFKAFLLRQDYKNSAQQTTVELIFQTNSLGRHEVFGSQSKNEQFLGIISAGRNCKIKLATGNPFSGAFNTISQWIKMNFLYR